VRIDYLDEEARGSRLTSGVSAGCSGPFATAGLFADLPELRERKFMKRCLFAALLAVALGASVGSSVRASSASTMTIAPTSVPLTMVGTSSFAGGLTSTYPAVDTSEFDQAILGDTDASDGVDFGAGV
jgi:hypothetical protein